MVTNPASADTSNDSGNEDPGKILLVMAVGIILGNFVPNTGPALQKGKFVGVSIPIVFFIKVISPSADAISVAKSVAVFLDIPLGAAIITRFPLRKVVSPT
ncbi:MAG: hypothetical protein M1839_004451 [Geoglossum umbratile]|nr:MAG: hypothetical protein M1839_004451 [Geoglossum umbratile]